MATSRHERRRARSALANAQAAADTAATLMVRLPLFGKAMLAPNAAAAFEWNRAVSEKIFAAFEGATAAAFAWQRFWIGAAFRAPNAAAIGAAMEQAMEAAAGPARRKVASNARRLGRR